MAATTPLPPTIDLLLNLIDTRPASVLNSLAAHPQLAAAADSHGYSLVHASASYHQLDVLRALIQTYNADVNLVDEDGETALFTAESVEVAKCLIEELGADWRHTNSEGKTAEERMLEEEGADNVVYRYLKGLREQAEGGDPAQNGENGVHLPSLPEGVKVSMGTMDELEELGEPDPEFKRRIDELAARPDFQTPEVQAQLRELVQEALSGLGSDSAGRSVRRRVD